MSTVATAPTEGQVTLRVAGAIAHITFDRPAAPNAMTWAKYEGLADGSPHTIRLAAAGARFRVPIARTLGNCLSAANLRRLCATLGVSWVKRMLLLAEMPTAEMLLASGYLEAVVPQPGLAAEVERVCGRLLGHAPITVAATRETLRRLAVTPQIDISDLIRQCYGSADFHRGVEAFAGKGKV